MYKVKLSPPEISSEEALRGIQRFTRFPHVTGRGGDIVQDVYSRAIVAFLSSCPMTKRTRSGASPGPHMGPPLPLTVASLGVTLPRAFPLRHLGRHVGTHS